MKQQYIVEIAGRKQKITAASLEEAQAQARQSVEMREYIARIKNLLGFDQGKVTDGDRKLAEYMGVTLDAISKIKAGRKSVLIKSIVNITETLEKIKSLENSLSNIEGSVGAEPQSPQENESPANDNDFEATKALLFQKESSVSIKEDQTLELIEKLPPRSQITKSQKGLYQVSVPNGVGNTPFRSNSIIDALKQAVEFASQQKPYVPEFKPRPYPFSKTGHTAERIN